MIQITDKSKCCGCTACASVCPQKAIKMVQDKDGFKYPIVDIEKCTNCGACDKVCPYINEYAKKKTFEKSIAYGGWNKNEEILKNSTSGGIFSSLAKYIIDNNGVVCGAIYDEKLNVVHTIIDNMEDLKKVNGSKYVQSDMGENFRQIKKYLQDNRLVLFSGTPCQVAGLNSFLGKEYENLYICDIICHGVPSPKVFDKYKNELEKQNSSKLVSINFRDKCTGWQGYTFSAKFENGTEFKENANQNSYMKAFLNDIDLRQSCPTCKFAKLPRSADFTLGDFWGVDINYPNLNLKNKGTSLILVHTKKGQELLLNNTDIFIQECELYKSIEYNKSVILHNPAHKNREKFFKELDNMTIDRLINKFVNENIVKRILRKIKRIIKK